MSKVTINKDNKIPSVKLSFPSILNIQRADKLEGIVRAPSSKSYTHRAIVIGSMNGESTIINPLISEDTLATLNAWEKLGLDYSFLDENLLKLKGFDGHPKLPKAINVHESGTLLRFLTCISVLGKSRMTINGAGTLMKRSNVMIVDPLKQLGMKVKSDNDDYSLPLTVDTRGDVIGGTIRISGDMSSQIISALLIISPHLPQFRLEIEGKMVSRPYIRITLDVLNRAGIVINHDENLDWFETPGGQHFKSLGEFVIPGDYSNAAFLLAAASLIKSDVLVTNLLADEQGDRAFLDILKRMGAIVEIKNDSVRIKGPFELHGIDIDCGDIPDIVPAIAPLAVYAKGRTRLFNIGHLKIKESNRIMSITEELNKLGVRIESDGDQITIWQSKPRGTEVWSHNDHRIAMAMAVIGLREGQMIIKDSDCISKSYVDFLKDMKSLGAPITV